MGIRHKISSKKQLGAGVHSMAADVGEDDAA